MNEVVAYWNGAAGERWAAEQATLDVILGPFGDAALASARVTRDEAVLDVGCGCGDTTFTLAALVGSGGRVLGLDVSAPMLARARARRPVFPQASFVEGDASTEPLPAASFDLVFSRFGVMFFLDPVAALAHLRAALRPGGRIAFVCWQPLVANAWASVPFEAVVQVLGRPEPSPPDAPGPFAFGDADRVLRILEKGGYRAAKARSVEGVPFGDFESLDAAAREMARIGPAARLLAERDDADRARAVAAIERALVSHVEADGHLRLGAACWVVTATAS